MVVFMSTYQKSPSARQILFKINLAKKKAQKAVNDYRRELINFQVSCKHSQVIEGEYSPGKFFGSLPPFRVCTRCGYAEDGWGCGYTMLNNDQNVEEVSRDEADKYVRGMILPNLVHFEAKRRETSRDGIRKSLRKVLEEHQKANFSGE